jgi:phosphate transport system permease protein
VDAPIWLAGTGLAVSLLMIAGMIAVIVTNGLGFFWPKSIERLVLQDGSIVAGERVQIEEPFGERKTRRIQIRAGNRDLTGQDFVWVDEDQIQERTTPSDLWFIERREYGPLIGTPVRLVDRSGQATEMSNANDAARTLRTGIAALVRDGAEDRDTIERLQKESLGAISAALERTRLKERAIDRRSTSDPGRVAAERAALGAERAELERRFADEEARLGLVQERAAIAQVVFRSPQGAEKTLKAVDLYRAYEPNRLGFFARAQVYFSRLFEFLLADPRESNTEGGILPALFGTVLMVLLMSVAAVPFGVVTAIYLREYATQGALVRVVRIAVNNLAGVPSIVFGVFGLGFFVYVVGGSIDRVFFPDALPAPTFGTGGLLWASLTLALLTVPVVIVATEEALAAVPRSMREASVAMGATQFQTISRVVLPAAAPGILTGLILAMARGAGEVAPLMITGVVKLAPELPFDGSFPFLHIDRKFMHLAFHIYDVGFQSPNVEAAKPMVYMTTIFLLLIVVTLNLVAIVVRNRLRRRYQTSAF